MSDLLPPSDEIPSPPVVMASLEGEVAARSEVEGFLALFLVASLARDDTMSFSSAESALASSSLLDFLLREAVEGKMTTCLNLYF